MLKLDWYSCIEFRTFVFNRELSLLRRASPWNIECNTGVFGATIYDLISQAVALQLDTFSTIVIMYRYNNCDARLDDLFLTVKCSVLPFMLCVHFRYFPL